MLADLGAEVIKVETPLLGDYARFAPDDIGGDTMFKMINRGKKSVAVNYRNKKGREIFLNLAEKADVIVETFKPGSVDKWGIGYEAVRERNPGVIYCSISGYGQQGPYRDKPGHDINYIAIGGLLGLTGEPGQIPSPPGLQTADLGAATFAVMNILASILERGRTGEGRYLDVAMLDPIVHWMMPTIGSQYFGTGELPQRGRLPLAGGWPCNRVYRTKDNGFLALGALEPPFWSAFCKLVERPDLLKLAFDESAIPDVTEIFATRSLEDWLSAFKDLSVPIEPVYNIAETLADPQVNSRGLLRPTADPKAAPDLLSPFPFEVAQSTVPELGEHTELLLKEIGYSQADIDAWHSKKLIKIL
jgi:crotonobetainyl-CoA:carnitine CoA-transferase CaiB-like acyl-CoA transferase